MVDLNIVLKEPTQEETDVQKHENTEHWCGLVLRKHIPKHTQPVGDKVCGLCVCVCEGKQKGFKILQTRPEEDKHKDDYNSFCVVQCCTWYSTQKSP